MHRRAVTALALLDGVAALVVCEGIGVFAAVFQPFPECEAQMLLIHRLHARCALQIPHAGDFVVREAVGLQVREAPERLAEAGPYVCRTAVGTHRLFLLAEGLQRMPQGLRNLGIAREFLDKGTEARHGFVQFT